MPIDVPGKLSVVACLRKSLAAYADSYSEKSGDIKLKIALDGSQAAGVVVFWIRTHKIMHL